MKNNQFDEKIALLGDDVANTFFDMGFDLTYRDACENAINAINDFIHTHLIDNAYCVGDVVDMTFYKSKFNHDLFGEITYYMVNFVMVDGDLNIFHDSIMFTIDDDDFEITCFG